VQAAEREAEGDISRVGNSSEQGTNRLIIEYVYCTVCGIAIRNSLN
jgi:hypothetical protein